MNIIKYKKLTNGRYKVILENNVELTLYEDIILKYQLLIKKDISDESISLIKEKSRLAEGGRLVHLVIDGLRIKEHSTHFSFLQALEVSSRIGGEHIWFTHLTHNSSHTETAAYIEEHRGEFPALSDALSILPAYDGLVLSTGD